MTQSTFSQEFEAFVKAESSYPFAIIFSKASMKSLSQRSYLRMTFTKLSHHLSISYLVSGVVSYDGGDRIIILRQTSHVQWTLLVVSSSKSVLFRI